MNKRLASKRSKSAERKIIDGKPLGQLEKILFIKKMEKWLGPEIVARIKQFGKAE